MQHPWQQLLRSFTSVSLSPTTLPHFPYSPCSISFNIFRHRTSSRSVLSIRKHGALKIHAITASFGSRLEDTVKKTNTDNPVVVYPKTWRSYSSEVKSSLFNRLELDQMDLSLEKCVPCKRKDLRPMSEGSANVLKSKVRDWELLNDDGVLKLRRKWKVKNFLLGLEFFKIVADLAESEGHHPDLHLVGWNNVTIEIWTHACSGLTENDFILAAKIDKLPFQSYLK